MGYNRKNLDGRSTMVGTNYDKVIFSFFVDQDTTDRQYMVGSIGFLSIELINVSSVTYRCRTVSGTTYGAWETPASHDATGIQNWITGKVGAVDTISGSTNTTGTYEIEANVAIPVVTERASVIFKYYGVGASK